MIQQTIRAPPPPVFLDLSPRYTPVLETKYLDETQDIFQEASATARRASHASVNRSGGRTARTKPSEDGNQSRLRRL